MNLTPFPSQREGCAVHASVLMTNRVHLLLTPREPGQVWRVMQALGRRYVPYINDCYHRTGTLWEGRYKACLVAGDRDLLHCHRYIALNPVRVRMVAGPAQYRWSSHRRLAFACASSTIRTLRTMPWHPRDSPCSWLVGASWPRLEGCWCWRVQRFCSWPCCLGVGTARSRGQRGRESDVGAGFRFRSDAELGRYRYLSRGFQEAPARRASRASTQMASDPARFQTDRHAGARLPCN